MPPPLSSPHNPRPQRSHQRAEWSRVRLAERKRVDVRLVVMAVVTLFVMVSEQVRTVRAHRQLVEMVQMAVSQPQLLSPTELPLCRPLSLQSRPLLRSPRRRPASVRLQLPRHRTPMSPLRRRV